MQLIRDNKKLVEDYADEDNILKEKLGLVQHLKVVTQLHDRIHEGKDEFVNFLFYSQQIIEKRLTRSKEFYQED